MYVIINMEASIIIHYGEENLRFESRRYDRIKKRLSWYEKKEYGQRSSKGNDAYIVIAELVWGKDWLGLLAGELHCKNKWVVLTLTRVSFDCPSK